MLGRDGSDATTGSFQCITLKRLSSRKLPAENRCAGRGLQQGRCGVGQRRRQGWMHGGTGGYGAGQCTVTALSLLFAMPRLIGILRLCSSLFQGWQSGSWQGGQNIGW